MGPRDQAIKLGGGEDNSSPQGREEMATAGVAVTIWTSEAAPSPLCRGEEPVVGDVPEGI